MNRDFPPHCYHCSLGPFTTVDSYEIHVVTKHVNLPGYPGPGDLISLHLKPQGMRWEKELPEDQALNILRNHKYLYDKKQKLKQKRK